MRRAEYGISMVTWALFAAAFVVELDRYCPRRTWLIRFPVLFIFAGEVAKARCAAAERGSPGAAPPACRTLHPGPSKAVGAHWHASAHRRLPGSLHCGWERGSERGGPAPGCSRPCGGQSGVGRRAAWRLTYGGGRRCLGATQGCSRMVLSGVPVARRARLRLKCAVPS